MEPYQEASERIREKSEQPGNFIKKAGSLGLGLAAGTAASPIIARMMPFLSDFIPADLAIKGLTKINPKFGEFIDKSLKNGFSFSEIKDFLGQQGEKVEKNKPKTIFDEMTGGIEIESLPENVQNQLAFLRNISDTLEKKGKSREDPAFKKLEKKVKDTLSGKLGDLQSEAMGLPMQQQAPMQQQQDQPNQSGPGQQALMAMLQQINQKLGT